MPFYLLRTATVKEQKAFDRCKELERRRNGFDTANVSRYFNRKYLRFSKPSTVVGFYPGDPNSPHILKWWRIVEE